MPVRNQPMKARKPKRAAVSDDRTARARILSMAEEQFAAHGFEGTSLRQIALQACVPVALVSYHFNGKLALYRDVFLARYQNLVEQRKAGLALAQMEEDRERRLEMIVKAVM